MLPAIYAHRLGRAYGPDSSRTALTRTLEQQVDGLETDCCLTADGDIVLLHDPLLQLGTNLAGWAHQRTAAEICAGRLRDRTGGPSDERPLRLGELLDLVPRDVALQLEIKAHADPTLARETTRAVLHQLNTASERDRVEIISFFTSACELAANLGLAARAIVIADYRIEELAEWADGAGVGGVCVEHFLLSPSVVETLQTRGLSVTTGTINHPEMLPVLLGLGLDAITSDGPHELLDALRAMGGRALAPADAARPV
jgi:glycerophosphoryl diester phosphodiesterase